MRWRSSGLSLLSQGNYAGAEAKFQLALGAARAVGDLDSEGRAYSAFGSVELTLHRYRKSLDAFLQAARLLRESSDQVGSALVKANIGSLYGEMGDVDRAAQWVEEAMHELPPADLAAHLSQMQIQLAILRAQEKDGMPAATALFWAAIEGAYRAKDWDTYGKAWNRLGDAYLKRGDLFGERRLAEAEKPLEEALKVRLQKHLPPETAYRSLGRLRLEQGRLTDASNLLDRAIAISVRPNSGLPSWDAYQYRGEVRRRAGDLHGALNDYRTAVRLAREILRRDAPPDEQARMAAEGRTELGKLHGAMVDIAGLLYQRTGGREFLREGFEVAEENRANSLLAPAPESLPDAYWAALGRLQRAEANAVRSPGTDSAGAAQTARNSLAAIEASLTGAPQPPAEGVLHAMQAGLDGQTALLTFAEAEDCVWMWAVDRSAVSLYRLPPAAQIQQLDARARAAINDNAPDAKIAGAQLYAALFGQLAPRFRAKSRWLLALDESLFSIPFAALPDGPLASAPYVVERRTIEVIPGVAHWLAAAQNPKPALTPSMVALGDPIYNAADPRLKTNPAQASASFFQLVASERGGLPRLVGSGAEIDICARNWGKGAVLLQGAGATREALLQEMAKSPAALHLATHVIDSSGIPPQGLIALTVGRSGAPELLEPREIESWRYRLGLVTMSGCASASPTAARSGSGLLGLTRAWLAAGARQVIASRWNVPDESGALFAALYRNLASGGTSGPALALRRAQIEMLRSRDWRSQPRYWGAYFVIGKE